MTDKHTVERTYSQRVWDGKTDDYIQIPVTVTIHFDSVARNLANRAHRSKHGKATALHGAIVVTKQS